MNKVVNVMFCVPYKSEKKWEKKSSQKAILDLHIASMVNSVKYLWEKF